jgi:hypothetical protein
MTWSFAIYDITTRLVLYMAWQNFAEKLIKIKLHKNKLKPMD